MAKDLTFQLCHTLIKAIYVPTS